MMGPRTDTPAASSTEASALAVKNMHFSNPHKGGRPWCDHCKCPGHTKETCWNIHGKLVDLKTKNTSAEKESRGHMAANSDSGMSLSREELDALRQLLRPQTSVIGSGSLTQSGNFLHALLATQEQSKVWIIDSGAIDHMAGDKSVFHTFIPCTQNLNVRIADGSLSKVAVTGTFALQGGLSLHHVLFVPKLNCCFLSVSKLTLDNNCMVNFFPLCVNFRIWIRGR
ncbi:hypothetical protein ACOSP7_009436 [Xanthoceras sorbifolium]